MAMNEKRIKQRRRKRRRRRSSIRNRRRRERKGGVRVGGGGEVRVQSEIGGGGRELLFLSNLFRISTTSSSLRVFAKISFNLHIFVKIYKIWGRIVKESEKKKKGDNNDGGLAEEGNRGDRGVKKKRKTNGRGKESNKKAKGKQKESKRKESIGKNASGQTTIKDKVGKPRVVNINVNAKVRVIPLSFLSIVLVWIVLSKN